MFRYSVGNGTAARFNEITDIDFLSTTELICTDRNNHCLRLVDFTPSPPETSMFAGTCTLPGNTDGHRLSSALFRFPAYTEVNNNKSILFVLHVDDRVSLRMIDLKTENVTKLITFNDNIYDMKLFGNSMLYLAQATRVTVFNLGTKEERVVADGARGRFDFAYGLWPWRDEGKIILLVADALNNRFANCSCHIRIYI